MSTLVLSVRVSEEERALLEAASELARTSLSEFIRRKALDAAEADVLERRIALDELGPEMRSDRFGVLNLLNRLAHIPDPWRDMRKAARRLPT